MAETEKDGLLEDVLNELDITFKDDRLEKKIAGILKRGKAYLNDKFGSEIEFDKDGQAMELLVSYCRYGRSNAIEQFKHDFSSEFGFCWHYQQLHLTTGCAGGYSEKKNRSII